MTSDLSKSFRSLLLQLSATVARQIGDSMPSFEFGAPALLFIFQTSAKTNVNIEKAFIDLSEAILEKTPDISKPPQPPPTPAQSRAGPGCGCN